MISQESRLRVADNTGAKESSASAFSAALVAATRGSATSRRYRQGRAAGAGVKKGDVVRAVVVRTAKERRRADVVHQVRRERRSPASRGGGGEPRGGTRIFGPWAAASREALHAIISLARRVVAMATPMKSKVKKGDTVEVIAGKSRA